MNFRIIDCKVVIRDGNICLAPNYFGIDERRDRYYRKVIRLTENQNSARVRWFIESIKSLGSLQLETEV